MTLHAAMESALQCPGLLNWHTEIQVKYSMSEYAHAPAMQVREELQQAKAEAAVAARAQTAAAAALLPKEPAAEAEDAETEPADTQARNHALHYSTNAYALSNDKAHVSWH